MKNITKSWGSIWRIAMIIAVPALVSCKDETNVHTASNDEKIEALELRLETLEGLLAEVKTTEDEILHRLDSLDGLLAAVENTESELALRLSALDNLFEVVTPTENGLVVDGLVVTDQDLLDYVAKSVVEGTVFISPAGLTETEARLNGNNAHLCSAVNNPGYNNGHRFKVHFRNRDVSGLADGKSIDEVNEQGLSVYCLDTYFGMQDLNLIVNASGDDIEKYIDSAEIYVTHTMGDLTTLVIEAVEIRHSLSLAVLSNFQQVVTDNRSSNSQAYKVSKDEEHGYFER